MKPQPGVTRRQFLSRAAVVALAAAGGSALARWARSAASGGVAFAQDLFARIKGLPPEITPNDQFYIVSKNPPGFDPRLDAGKWTLEVTGKVGRPLRLTFDEVRAMPAVEQLQTLECISNEVGGDLISNAKWKGIRLRDLLARAGGAAPTAVKVAFRCADGYSESIPIGDAMNATTLLAYEMNGETLPPAHGYPLRLLIPGLFGMKNPKWITRIEVVDYDFQGYWQASGWTDDAVVKTMSKFEVASQAAGGDVELGGVAYAGDRGIKEVEYSTDDGKTWSKAAVKPALGKFTWALWAAVWKPAAAASYVLKVRAKDGNSVLQLSKPAPTLPDGASGYHTIRIRVRK
ncbi:MAG: molybdopterin-dependent oxidoreductase [bacterium]